MPYTPLFERIKELEEENERMKKEYDTLLKSIEKFLNSYKLQKELRNAGLNPSIISIEYAYHQIINRQK